MNQPWAELLIGSLAGAGAEHFVVSPGSRSTPLVLAIARLGVPATVIIDERSAAFYALGRARVTGRPSVLVCTSGSAGAHYLPALVEADTAQIPLIAVTADRPPELHGCSAPQTIDQQHLFGRTVRAFVDTGMPDPHPAALSGLARKARQLVALSMGPVPGPVHINVPARKPLEPTAEPTAGERAMQVAVDQRIARPGQVPIVSHTAAPDQALADLAAILERAERPLFVTGPAPLRDRARTAAIARLASVGRVPLLAEVTSGLRLSHERPSVLINHFDLLVKSPGFAQAMRPDVIVQIGRAPVSRSLTAYLHGQSAELIVLASETWSDVTGRATVIAGEVTELCSRLAERMAPPNRDESWLRDWQSADGRARAAIDEALATSHQPMSEALACNRLVTALPTGSTVILGNSLPVRTAELLRSADEGSIDVLGQRGAAGIDGLVAGAAGSCDASGAPTLLLVGDVSFAHDLASLAIARAATTPLILGVIDNGGGRIFEQLPIARSAGAAELMERFFITRPAIDFEHAARAYGVPYQRANDPAAIDRAMTAALAGPGATIVHMPTATDGAVDFDRRALAALEKQS